MSHRLMVVVAGLFLAPSLFAQEPTGGQEQKERSPEEERAVALGVVQVTAQRRKEDVQRIPSQ